MKTALVRSVKEKWLNPLWWRFFLAVLASYLVSRCGWSVCSAKLIELAKACYISFFAQQQERFRNRIDTYQGEHRYHAVLRAFDPASSTDLTGSFWLRADNPAQAMERIHSIEWGERFKVVSFSGRGTEAKQPGVAPLKLREFFSSAMHEKRVPFAVKVKKPKRVREHNPKWQATMSVPEEIEDKLNENDLEVPPDAPKLPYDSTEDEKHVDIAGRLLSLNGKIETVKEQRKQLGGFIFPEGEPEDAPAVPPYAFTTASEAPGGASTTSGPAKAPRAVGTGAVVHSDAAPKRRAKPTKKAE